MLDFIAANLATVLISILFLAIVILICCHLIRERKSGHCSGNCAGCPGCSGHKH